MDQERAYQILRSAFSVLNAEQIENFRWHLKRETPVMCRNDAYLYVNVNGGG